MSSLTCREIAFGSAEYLAALQLREAILRNPLDLKLEKTDTENDPREWHFGAFDGEALAACVILRPLADKKTAKLRQMAVRPQYRGRGIGRALVRFAKDTARSRFLTRIKMHARDIAVPFYQALGYACLGDYFEENTIPHIKMARNL